MLNLSNVKDQVKSLEGKTYLLNQLEPEYKNEFIEVTIETSDEDNEGFEISDLVEFGKVYDTIRYEDIKTLDIDNILIGLELKNGTVYFLKQQRNDLTEILRDFKKCSNDLIIDDGSERLIGINDFNVTEQENEIVISGKEFDIHTETETGGKTYIKIDKDSITGIDESYIGSNNDRSVRIYLGNDECIQIA